MVCNKICFYRCIIKSTPVGSHQWTSS